MKKYFYALMAVMALCLVGCKDKNAPSDTTGENGEISETGVKNEFGEGRLIIGKWTTGGNYPKYFTFRSDGTFNYYYPVRNAADIDEEGYWSYDPETKILASTINVIGAMKINIMTPQALQGTTTGGTNYGLSHSSYYVDKNRNLIVGKWKTNDGKELVFDKSMNFTKDKTVKGKYSIVDEENTYGGWNIVIFFDNKKYELSALSGGYLKIEPEEYYSEETEFAGEYYYVIE